jgi:hypothetical protein
MKPPIIWFESDQVAYMTRQRLFPWWLLLVSTVLQAEEIVLPGMGDNEMHWLPVDPYMSSSAYSAATRNNLRVLGRSAIEGLTDLGIPESVIGVTGSAVRLFSGEEITLFNSQNLSINTNNMVDDGGGAFMNYSVGW